MWNKYLFSCNYSGNRLSYYRLQSNWACQFYIMKVVKSRAFKDRLKGHKESVIALFSPYGEDGHMLYSISKDGSVRGSSFITQAGILPKDKSPSKPCSIRN